MTPNICQSSAELSHVAEPNIRPNSSAELRRLPNFGPSLRCTVCTVCSTDVGHVLSCW